MYLVAIGWMYVVLMMAVAEAMSTQGTVLGALITFVFYGLMPVSIIIYILGTPSRKRARLKAEQAAEQAAGQAAGQAAEAALAPAPVDGSSAAPDGGGQAPGGAVAPEREKI